ncbi:MAG: hypothetical protein BWY71_01133 [Planctomycetes bacterium ADurb.Bin412]|nr:MAG: hypothetical protein BWY71_01133 [Planctomycetes bacterium ADurb.Bin412]
MSHTYWAIQDSNLCSKNHKDLHEKKLEENEKGELTKNCQNQGENLPLDPELTQLNRVWPSLDADTRRQIVELARKGGGE